MFLLYHPFASPWSVPSVRQKWPIGALSGSSSRRSSGSARPSDDRHEAVTSSGNGGSAAFSLRESQADHWMAGGRTEAQTGIPSGTVSSRSPTSKPDWSAFEHFGRNGIKAKLRPPEHRLGTCILTSHPREIDESFTGRTVDGRAPEGGHAVLVADLDARLPRPLPQVRGDGVVRIAPNFLRQAQVVFERLVVGSHPNEDFWVAG